MSVKFDNFEHALVAVASGTVAVGDVAVLGQTVGIAFISGVSGDRIPYRVHGRVAGLTSDTGTAWVVGDNIFYDSGNAYFTKTATGNTFAGKCSLAKASGTATCEIVLGVASPIVKSASAAQAAVATTGATNSSPYGFTGAAQADAIVTLVNAMRTALIANGIIKGAA